MILHSQLILAIQFRRQGNFAVYEKDYRNVSTPRKNATDAIRRIASDNPAKISHNYTYLCEFLDNQPIKITTRFSGSSDVTGRHQQLVDSDVAERRKRLEAIG